MVFSSIIFLFFFLVIAVGVYYLVPFKAKNIWLLLVSLGFYAWGEPKYVFLMLISIVTNYLFGIWIDRDTNKTRRKIILVVDILYNLFLLYWFKYTTFTFLTIDQFFGTAIVEHNPWIQNIVMPIGISFFTFQILSYVVDVYRGQVPCQKNILKLGLYISLFPQLIAGPIVRYIDVQKQIDERSHSFEGAYQGTVRFVRGFIKKVLFSNTLAQIAMITFDQGGANESMLLAWLGIVAYTLQIYYDFSGYSDMAIGLGKLFGFDFLENFNYPYCSCSIQEFWRRWHISLSSWFRDYLYIPLGGNRKSTFATYRNLLIVFFVTGLWHGASFNFIVWGLFHGLFMLLERAKLGEILKKIPKWIGYVYTMLVVMIGWVFFRAETLSDALIYIRNMFDVGNFHPEAVLAQWNKEFSMVLVMGIIFAFPVVDGLVKKQIQQGNHQRLMNCLYLLVLWGLFLLSICYITGSGFNPFIYFRF